MKKNLKTILFALSMAMFIFGCFKADLKGKGEPVEAPVSMHKREAGPPDTEERIKDETVWGLLEDMTFHTDDCKRLQGVPDSKKRKIKSLYQALDFDFHPCKECQPERACWEGP